MQGFRDRDGQLALPLWQWAPATAVRRGSAHICFVQASLPPRGGGGGGATPCTLIALPDIVLFWLGRLGVLQGHAAGDAKGGSAEGGRGGAAPHRPAGWVGGCLGGRSWDLRADLEQTCAMPGCGGSRHSCADCPVLSLGVGVGVRCRPGEPRGGAAAAHGGGAPAHNFLHHADGAARPALAHTAGQQLRCGGGAVWWRRWRWWRFWGRCWGVVCCALQNSLQNSPASTHTRPSLGLPGPTRLPAYPHLTLNPKTLTLQT